MERGARNTAITAGLTVDSTRSSNAELPCRELADSACAIHSQHMAARENREGGIGVLGRKTECRYSIDRAATRMFGLQMVC
jgi:hypothetical protein